VSDPALALLETLSVNDDDDDDDDNDGLLLSV
jgi:hypothetical protein